MRTENVKISHPDKLLFPAAGITKEAVAKYYERIAPYMIPWICRRPLTLKRFSAGISKPGFFNKHAPDYFPDYVERLEVPMRSQGGRLMQMVSVDEPADLVYLAGQNVIELHMGLAAAPQLDVPDQLIIDLDPCDSDFAKVREVALVLKDILDELARPSFLKTTGSRGLHIHLPLVAELPFDEVKKASRTLAEMLHARCGGLTTLEMRKDKRGDKVFIDYLRNDYAMTAVAPYSLRALPSAPLAAPIAWSELRERQMHPQQHTIKSIFRRLAQKTDPWREFDSCRRELPAALIAH